MHACFLLLATVALSSGRPHAQAADDARLFAGVDSLPSSGVPGPVAVFGEQAFALVLARLSGLFLLAPLLSSAMLPTRFKALLAIGLSAAVYPTLDTELWLPARLDLASLAPIIASELLVGVSIGAIAMVPLATAQLAGLIMGQQMGLGLAQVLNPSVDIEGDNLGQVLFFGALAAFLSMGGMEVLFATLWGTFERLPPGAISAHMAPASLLTGVIQSGFDVALRIAMPVLLILTLESAAVGFIGKSVPSLNITAVGFPIRIVLGLFVVAAFWSAVLRPKRSHVPPTLSLRVWK